MIPTAWLGYLRAAMSAAIALAAFGTAWTVQDWRYGAREAVELKQQAVAVKANANRADTASEAHEVTKTQLVAKFKKINQEAAHVVEKPIYRDMCFDADGLRLLGQAIGDSTAAGEPTHPVPDVVQP